MGSRFFSVLGYGADPEDAFTDALRSQACIDSRSGLMLKRNYLTVDAPTRWLSDAEDLVSSTRMGGDAFVEDRWGPAGAVPVAVPAPGEGPHTRTVALTVTVAGDPAAVLASPEPDDEPGWLRFPTEQFHTRRQALAAAVAVSVELGMTERLEAVRILDARPTWKVSTQVSSGVPVTRYVLTGTDVHTTWEHGFTSRSQARTVAEKLAASGGLTRPQSGCGGFPSPVAIGIQALVRRPNGEVLLEVSPELVSTVFDVSADITSHPPVPVDRRDGWLFFGLAAT